VEGNFDLVQGHEIFGVFFGTGAGRQPDR